MAKEKARQGDTVRIHYTGTLRDGSVFDSSRGRDPFQFVLGSGQVIPGFDVAVTGMAPGEQKTVTIPAADAYGEPREEMVVAVGRDEFPAHVNPEPGQRLQMSDGTQSFAVVVREVTDDRIVLDGNHPLAGEELTFVLELLDVQ
jgi:peptidylprolyl isomerase